MSLEVIRAALGWCMVINWAILLVWLIMIASARDFVYGVHGKWFDIPRERLDQVHYQAMVLFKIAIILFNLAPYLALRIVG